MYNDAIKKLSSAVLLASVLTFLGWAALHLVPQKRNWNWVAYSGGMLAMPGVFFSVAVAMIFSPQGGHGADDFSCLVVPFNLIFYFMLFFLLFHRRKSPPTAA